MQSKKSISLIILIFIALQIYAGMRFHHRSWPFIAYPMYAEKHGPREKIVMLHLFGYTVSEARVAVVPEDFGLWSFPFDAQVTPRLLKPVARQACASELLSLYNERRTEVSEQLRRLEVVMESRVINQNGPPVIRLETLFVYEGGEQDK